MPLHLPDHRRLPIALPSLLCLCLAQLAQAQDLRREQPRPVPPVIPAPSRALADAVLQPLAGLKLAGLVLLAEPAQVKDKGWPVASHRQPPVDASRLPRVAGNAALLADLGQLIGQAYTDVTLRQLQRLLQQAYASTGNPFVSVVLPPQDVTNGVVQVLVMEGRLGKISVTGNQHFSPQVYLGAMRSRSGEPIDAAMLDEDLKWIGQNPFRSATATAQPGAQPGQTDLVLNVQDRRPWRVYSGVDNTGSPTTGRYRYQIGGNYGNLFGLGHQLGVQRTASPDNDASVSHSINYVAPLPWRHTLLVSASKGKLHTQMPEPFDQRGGSSSLSVKYRVPLEDWGKLNHNLTWGLDYKRSDNNLLFSQIPVTDNRTDIYQFSLAWDGQVPDEWGSNGWGLTVVHSPGGRGSYNQNEAFNTSRAGATARYTYLNLSVQRGTPLIQGMSLQTNLSWQMTDSNLLGSEQLPAGGANAVRGFGESAAYGDKGLVLRNELQFAPAQGISRWFNRLPSDQVQVLTFVDWARVAPRNPLDLEARSTTLASVGVGARWQFGNAATIRLDWGKPVRYSRENKPGGRWHANASFSW